MKRKLLFYSAFILILGAVAIGSIATWMQDGFSYMLWSALWVYELMEIGIAFLLGRYEKAKDENGLAAKRMMQYYMLTKLGKLLVTVALIGIGVCMIGSENKSAVLTLAGVCVILYLGYLIAETIVLTKAPSCSTQRDACLSKNSPKGERLE